MKEQSAIGSVLFGAFPSDRLPKATKDVNVHYFFFQSSNSCKIYQRIPRTFGGYYVEESFPLLIWSQELEQPVYSLCSKI